MPRKAPSMNIKLEKALEQVRAHVVQLGVDKATAEKIDDIEVLLSLSKTLQKKDERVVSIVEKSNPKETKLTNRAFKSKSEIMYKKLQAQSKVSYMIALEGKEKPGIVREVKRSDGHVDQIYISGAIMTVQLNGYKYFVPKGVMVDIPKQVAKELAKSQQNTQEAGRDFLLDRNDPKTGGTVADALS